MAERTTIARPYADAAFEVARDRNDLAGFGTMLALAQTIAADPRMAEALASPKLDTDAKASLFLSIAGDRFSAEMRNFVRILIDGDRIGVLPEVRALYETRKDEADGVAKATIETAMPIPAAQLAELTGALERRFGKKIEVTVAENPALVGGARITVGDTVIDGSVRGKLAVMAQALSD
jgi:F-type H+-transporting ATPase subunit delta